MVTLPFEKCLAGLPYSAPMSRLSKFAQNRSARFMQKKLILIGVKLGLAGCGALAYYFPIFSDGNIAADGALYFIIIATSAFLWWEFCR
ncbi:hypothetical protein [Hellea balneolensis]|uniref:hypothetical protein n=1 Tax=Hellea balneolensis TaxID=287478 RepID=UPI00040A19B4|nr:hypothetical protein [Hellea balneolensis]